jgi:D-methionine transport system substrate-binding protein
MVSGLTPWAAELAPLRIIASPTPHAEILRFVQKQLAPDLALQIIEITNALRPNELLARGEVDANYFQHVPYLRQQEQDLGTQFAVIAAVHIEPLGLYSRRIRALEAVPDKATVSIPNNVTNLSRALYLLQDQKLIALRPDLAARERQLATPRDIIGNPHHLKIIEVDSAQIARSLDDVTIAVINGNYALEIGLTPSKDALALESAENNPYANVLVTMPKLKCDPRIQRLAELLTSHDVAVFIRERYRGSVIPVNP